MIDGVRLKFCGLRTLVDAEMADKLGADYLGFILHPESPRHLSLADYRHLAPNLPENRKHVAVMVAPTVKQLTDVLAAGFDVFQVHFRTDTPDEDVTAWSMAVGRERLWLSPHREPGSPINPVWLEAAQTFLVDTYQPDKMGGTGRTGDWGEFATLQETHPEHRWILAGGISPLNIGEALGQSGARWVDLNSGVEQAPGIKDHEKMRAAVLAIHRARSTDG
jgi:phosphoribosylanthranilate isomerase